MADTVTISTTTFAVTLTQEASQSISLTPAASQSVTVSVSGGSSSYTDSEARSAISVTGAGLSYNSTSGVITYAQADVTLSKVSDSGTTASLNTGIAQNNIPKFTLGVADDDFLRINGTLVEGRSASETLSDIGAAAASHNHAAGDITSGTLAVARIPDISTDKLTSGTLAVARGGTGLTSLSTLLNSNTTKSDVGLGNVTNIEAQPVDADLTAIAGLTSAADKGIQFTGSGSAGVYDLTAAGKALLDDADAAAQRTTLGLGTAATSATGDFSPVAGSSSIVTTGTIATGTWNATAIEDTKLDLRVDHGVTFDGQGSVIESAKVVLVPVERAGVIKAATLVGDASGAITITITKYDPAADATTLGSPSAVGTIALATKIINRDTTLSGWTLAVAEGDILAFTTGGTIATVTRVTCKLKLELA